MSDSGRDELVQATPDTYLADGYRDAAGHAWRDLRGIWASMACTQLMAAGLSPQELGFTIDAIGLLLPEQDAPTGPERLDAAMDEALSIVAGAIGQDNNEGLVEWLHACAARVADDGDIAPFLAHAEAVRRQYGTLLSLQLSSSPA